MAPQRRRYLPRERPAALTYVPDATSPTTVHHCFMNRQQRVPMATAWGSTRTATGTAPLRVLIADDDPAFVEMLTRYLANDPGIAVEGTAATLHEALAIVRGRRPDVVVLDFHLPDGDAELGTTMLMEFKPPLNVLVMSANATEEQISAVLRAGAKGYLPKERCVPELRPAIRQMSRKRRPAPAGGG